MVGQRDALGAAFARARMGTEGIFYTIASAPCVGPMGHILEPSCYLKSLKNTKNT
jgi:hypothetical protein